MSEEIIATSMAFDPVRATFIGVHDHDDRLPDFTPAAVDDHIRRLDTLVARLDGAQVLRVDPGLATGGATSLTANAPAAMPAPITIAEPRETARETNEGWTSVFIVGRLLSSIVPGPCLRSDLRVRARGRAPISETRSISVVLEGSCRGHA